MTMCCGEIKKCHATQFPASGRVQSHLRVIEPAVNFRQKSTLEFDISTHDTRLCLAPAVKYPIEAISNFTPTLPAFLKNQDHAYPAGIPFPHREHARQQRAQQCMDIYLVPRASSILPHK